MEQDLKLSQDVRDEMERYLASVAEALRRSGTVENEVQSVLQDVRNHLMERLAARAPQAPSLQDVREVIAGMSPPESYAETRQPAATAEAVPPAKGRTPLPDNQRRLLVVFGFVLILAALAFGFALPREENFPIALLAGIAGLLFVKWAVRSGATQEPTTTAQAGVPAYATRTEGRHQRLLMIFGFVLILAGLALTFARWEEGIPVAILAVIAGLIFVKWAVWGPSNRRGSCGWSCLTALAVLAALTIALLVVAWLLPWSHLSFAPLSSWFGHNAVQGSGHVITETRSADVFSHISASGVSIVNITQGEPQSVTIEADDNILPLIETVTNGDTLRIGYKSESWGGINPSKPVTVNVTLKQVSELEVSGATRLHAGSIATDALTIGETGATEVTIAEISSRSLKANITGAGKCDLAGKVDSQVVHGSGATQYSAGKLESQSAEVHLTGAGSATVWAKETLTVHATGACHVSYYGSPRVTQEASGVSSITSLGNH